MLSSVEVGERLHTGPIGMDPVQIRLFAALELVQGMVSRTRSSSRQETSRVPGHQVGLGETTFSVTFRIDDEDRGDR